MSQTDVTPLVQQIVDLQARVADLLVALERIRDEDGTSIVPGVVTSLPGIRLAYVKNIARAALAAAHQGEGT